MLTFYFHTSPNPMKVALLLEELAVPYDLKPIDIFKGAQHEAAFQAINPNAKVPSSATRGSVTIPTSNAWSTKSRSAWPPRARSRSKSASH